jgi:HK97 family phage major capsid protein
MNIKKIIGFVGLTLLAALAVAACYQLQLLSGNLHLLLGAGLALAAAPIAIPEEPLKEFEGILGELKGSWKDLKGLPASFKAAQDENGELKQQMNEVRRRLATRGNLTARTRASGLVSDDCARHLAAHFVAHCERSGKLEALASLPAQREALLAFARDSLGVAARSALTTSDIPLPSEYSGEIRELISEFGVVRRRMSPYPIGMGTARPARMGTRPSFGSIAMSAAFGEKSPAVTFASLESHKIGGIVRLPREIDEQSIVAMGQFLARYGAVEFARAEDTWGFLADGTSTYESVKGIVQIARDNANTVVLASTKTKPSDATLADFRSLRRKVNKAALSGRVSAYYLDSTWETQLPTFKTTSEQFVYQRLPDGSAILDGYPIVWTDVLTAYGTSAAADSPLAVFGALSFWWLGEHGSPRIDTSEHVWFANDQLAVRFIEEIDFDYAATDATAALITAAS